jgi:hypothetical protein
MHMSGGERGKHVSPTKTQACLDLLSRAAGATVRELQKATGWQPHSVRGFLSGKVKKKLGLTIGSTSLSRQLPSRARPGRDQQLMQEKSSNQSKGGSLSEPKELPFIEGRRDLRPSESAGATSRDSEGKRCSD